MSDTTKYHLVMTNIDKNKKQKNLTILVLFNFKFIV